MASLVLLPAIGLDAGFWEWVELPDAEVHKHEFPGFGRRPRAARPPTMDDLADDVAGAYAGPLDVLGVSMGGMVAQHLALRHPERVHSMLIACTGAAVDPAVMLERARATDAGGIEGVLESTLERWFTRSALEEEPEHRGVVYARRTLLALDPGSFADGWRTMAGHDVRDRLGEITARATCLCGTDDVVGTPERVGELAGGLQNGRFVMREGPHMLPLEQPDELSEAIRDHLDWVDA